MGSFSQFVTGTSPAYGLFHVVEVMCFHMSNLFGLHSVEMFFVQLAESGYLCSITRVTVVLASINQTPVGGSTFLPLNSARGINGVQM